MIIGGLDQICKVGIKTLFMQPMWEGMEFPSWQTFVYKITQFAVRET